MQLSLPRQDDRKTGKVTKICITKQRPTQSPPTVNIYTDIVKSTDESTLIFSYIRRFGSFFGFKILNFNIFGGFQKMKILWIFLGGHHKIGLYLGVISMHFRVFS